MKIVGLVMLDGEQLEIKVGNEGEAVYQGGAVGTNVLSGIPGPLIALDSNTISKYFERVSIAHVENTGDILTGIVATENGYYVIINEDRTKAALVLDSATAKLDTPILIEEVDYEGDINED